MVYKQFHITPRQNATLKRFADMFDFSEAEIIRRAIDHYLSAMPWRIQDLEAWEREKAFIASRMAAGVISSTRKWRRDEIYGERRLPSEQP